ncbi:hypothetical protein MAR_007671 [Mya arenaria]|uniref:Uncharacterized protein n=1 Tax=Mya arenaria TaxID=6604 RepID=A0ABY7DTT9_MYAAR|nr:hypothetical protein MAR_007671 [Mya arenaria]
MASLNAVMDSVKTMITPEVSVMDTVKAMIPPEVTNDGKTEPKMELISVQIEQEDQAKRKQTFMDDNCKLV